MIYDVRHLTRYDYGTFVPVARHLLRLKPLSGPALEALDCAIDIDPTPSERFESVDFFGNGLTHVSITVPHKAFAVECRSVVRVLPQADVAESATPPWEEVCQEARETRSLASRSPVHHLFPTRDVPLDPEIARYAAACFPAGRPILEGALDLTQRVSMDFEYDPDATDVMTPVRQAFDLRRGVCQDFAHIMISGLRSLGLPAAYVSGYLRTRPAPGRERMQGADAMHAWVSVWCGEAAGWVGLDPTNGVRTAMDHIPLAFGREYTDVSPVDGIIFDFGRHSVSVFVDVVARA